MEKEDICLGKLGLRRQARKGGGCGQQSPTLDEKILHTSAASEAHNVPSRQDRRPERPAFESRAPRCDIPVSGHNCGAARPAPYQESPNRPFLSSDAPLQPPTLIVPARPRASLGLWPLRQGGLVPKPIALRHKRQESRTGSRLSPLRALAGQESGSAEVAGALRLAVCNAQPHSPPGLLDGTICVLRGDIRDY